MLRFAQYYRKEGVPSSRIKIKSLFMCVWSCVDFIGMDLAGDETCAPSPVSFRKVRDFDSSIKHSRVVLGRYIFQTGLNY